MKAKCLFAVMCAVMMVMSVAVNNKEEVKKADADVVEKSLTIFENGSFYDEVIEHAAGSDITDGKWHNNAKWNASRALIKSSVDLSTYESIEITYTNVGTATWAQFGLGVQGGKGGTIEFDYVETGKSLTSDGAEHSVVINLSDFSSATSVKCTWSGGTHEKVLDMSSINGFSINAGDVTVNVSKIIAKKHETISTISKELTILKDGSFYSEQFSLNLSTFDGGVWKNDGSYNHSRIIFKDALDLINYETIEITYTATGTWNNKPEIGIGNVSSTEYDFVALEKSIDITGKESVVVLNISDYLNSQVSCTWGTVHEGKTLDITNIKGFSVKLGSTTMAITSIVAKSSLLEFVEKVKAFNLCGATTEQIQAMIEEYNSVLTKNANATYYQLDENATLGQRMDYMQYVYNNKVINTVNTDSGVVIKSIDYTDKTLTFVLIIALSLLSIGGYYFVAKRKTLKK